MSFIKAYITNLGKYNEGELVGEWVEFPVTKEELDAVYDRILIGHPDEFGNPYEEIFITDYDIDLPFKCNLGEYENIEELNYLAKRLEELCKDDFDKLCAVLMAGQSDSDNTPKGIINLSYNLDCYSFYDDIHSDRELGEYYAEIGFDISKAGILASYIDYDRLGGDLRSEEGGDFCKLGYVCRNGDPWIDRYDGDATEVEMAYQIN